MKALIYSKNLLGDGLQAGPAIKAFYEAHKGPGKGQTDQVDLTLCVHNDYSSLIYSRLGIEAKVATVEQSEMDESQYDFVFHMNVSKAFQLAMPTGKSCAAAFAIMLGVAIPNSLPVYIIPKEARVAAPSGLILLQPYSRSCSSHTNEPANKRWLPDSNWGRLYTTIRTQFPHLGVRVIGGGSDPLIPGVPEGDHWLGRDLDTIAATQGKATLVVTIDTGPAHLAASQCARTLELYPKCLPLTWMGKAQNPNWQCIYSRPAELSFDYVWQCVQKRLFSILEDPVISATAVTSPG